MIKRTLNGTDMERTKGRGLEESYIATSDLLQRLTSSARIICIK